MQHSWNKNPETDQYELVETVDFNQGDGMPKSEAVVLGGVAVLDELYFCGWAYNSLGHRIDILARFKPEAAQLDVERYLVKIGRLPNFLTHETTV